MFRLFYPMLFLATASLATALWVRHGSPNAWLGAAGDRIWRLVGASEARAQTYPVAGGPAAAGGAQREAAPPFEAPPAAGNAGEAGYPRTAAMQPRTAEIPFADASRFPPQSAPRRAVANGAGSAPAGSGAMLYVPESRIGPVPKEAETGGRPAAAAGALREIPHAKVIAEVGGEVILAGEVLGPVNEALAKNAAQIPPDQVEAYRDALMQRFLADLLETKVVVAAARQKIGEENLPKVTEKLSAAFEKERMPELLRMSGVKTRIELDAFLRQRGTSLEREKRAYTERTLATQWVRQNLDVDEEVTHEQMLAYYEENATRYDYPAQARWEQLMVKTSNYRNKEEAYRALAQMGNQVLDGAPLADVAKSRSDGPTAQQGGVYDWTTKGSLVSTALDRALFTLQIGALSPILEDERGFSIIRVLERKEAGRVPFTDVQPEIKKLLRNQRLNAQAKKYLDDLRDKTQIWTIYDGRPQPAPTSPQAAQSQPRRFGR